jgi:Tfp pilus assembly protein FimT
MCFRGGKGVAMSELLVALFITTLVIAAVVSGLTGALRPVANNTVNGIVSLTGAGF